MSENSLGCAEPRDSEAHQWQRLLYYIISRTLQILAGHDDVLLF